MNKSVVFCLLLLHISVSCGCRCYPTTIKEAYYKPSTDRYVEATAISVVRWDEYKRVYAFQVKNVYKGCSLKYFLAMSYISSATCAYKFEIGQKYLIPLGSSVTSSIEWLGSCHGIQPSSRLSYDDKLFLKHRNVCCETCKCFGLPDPVGCKASCLSTGCSAETKCVENHCSGCGFECVPKYAEFPSVPSPASN